MPAVSFQNVSKTYTTARGELQALKGVSFDIQPGEFFGLLGPNGAGKTTLISILAGLAKASGGQVLVHGHNVQTDYPAARRALGVVPQELVFDPFFNVREALRFQSGYFGIRHNGAWIDELLAGLGLADKADANMRQLSGGMKRRVLVAQALVHKPPVIVLDEPTAGVDVELRQTLWQFISQLNKQGSTVLLTTHYLEEAEALCGRIAMLNRGEVVALDRTSDLLRRAASNVLRFKTDDALPDDLAVQARVTGRVVQLPANDALAVERILARARESGVRADDVEIRKADLEDVFLEVIEGSNVARRAKEGVSPPGRPKAERTPSGGQRGRGSAERGGCSTMTGWQMLFYKEVLRFWKVGFQTVAAPVITAILYMMIFGHVLEGRVQVYDSVSYTAFLLPGLVMMSVLQNAFANSSSSLIQSKVMGNLVFLQLTPLSHRAWFVAYVGSSVVRGLAVGAGVMLATWWFAQPTVVAPLWILVFGIMGAALLGALGLIAGLWAEKFDQMAAFQNFVIVPMTFLSGVFYSIHSLPDVWQRVSHLNPFFYMIDGFRYGFFGVSDVSPWISLGLVGVALAAVSALALHLLRTGYKIRH